MIQRNADSFYPFSADYPDADPDESRSKLIVYWLVDRKLINAYLTKKKKAYKLLTSQKSFLTFKLMYCKIYINVLVYLCLYKHYTQ